MKSETITMPKALTAENGAKAIFISEFKELVAVPCPDCHELGCDIAMDDCEACGGLGSLDQVVPISWTTIKAIYAMAVNNFSKQNSLAVKQYTISECPDHGIWIDNDGEGMQVPNEIFHKLIDDFYKERF